MPEVSAQHSSRPRLRRPAPAHVADIMRSAVTTVERNDHAPAAAYLMRRKGVTALVLVDAQTNRPKGLITEADLVQLMADGRDPDAVRIHELMATRLSVIKATASIRDAANTMITGRFRHLPGHRRRRSRRNSRHHRYLPRVARCTPGNDLTVIQREASSSSRSSL